MEDNKLISMVDFVVEQGKMTIVIDEWEGKRQESLTKIYNYANFLKQPLTLGMFVLCDLEGNVMIKPNAYNNMLNTADWMAYNSDYQQAKERVLFEGLEFDMGIGLNFYYIRNAISEITISVEKSINRFPNNYKTIEDIVRIKPTLTPNALKQLS